MDLIRFAPLTRPALRHHQPGGGGCRSSGHHAHGPTETDCAWPARVSGLRRHPRGLAALGTHIFRFRHLDAFLPCRGGLILLLMALDSLQAERQDEELRRSCAGVAKDDVSVTPASSSPGRAPSRRSSSTNRRRRGWARPRWCTASSPLSCAELRGLLAFSRARGVNPLMMNIVSAPDGPICRYGGRVHLGGLAAGGVVKGLYSLRRPAARQPGNADGYVGPVAAAGAGLEHGGAAAGGRRA